MKRTSLFLLVTIAAIVSLIAVIAAGYFVLTAPSASTSNRWGNMWNGMMGGNGGMMNGYGYGNTSQTAAQSTAAPYFGIAIIILIVVAIVGIGGVIYFALFPEIRIAHATAQPFTNISTGSSITTQVSEAADSPYESVVKTLTPDERKIIQVLSAHDGKYLQKYIRSEAGFSRLQTHRIVVRLAERGVVTLEKTGNTNTVMLADWLKQ